MDHYQRTKDIVLKDLEGLSFDMKRIPIDKKEWRKFNDKLEKAALTLIREIYRSKNNYKFLQISDLSSNFRKENERIYCFDYFGEEGSVRFRFRKSVNDYIIFQDIEEEVYEESYSLF